MKLIPFFLLFAMSCDFASAQLLVPEPPPPRAVSNAAMLIQFGGQRIEVLPANRAVRESNGQYSIVQADVNEVMTMDRLGVGYSYASNSNIMLSGEVSVKLKPQYSMASLGSLAAGSKLLVSPDVYLLKASTPLDLIRMMGLLQANPAVSWAEPFTIRGRINSQN